MSNWSLDVQRERRRTRLPAILSNDRARADGASKNLSRRKPLYSSRICKLVFNRLLKIATPGRNGNCAFMRVTGRVLEIQNVIALLDQPKAA